ncbi:hypothetical protein HPB47_007547, partial [Ixodes persulcatus]
KATGQHELRVLSPVALRLSLPRHCGQRSGGSGDGTWASAHGGIFVVPGGFAVSCAPWNDGSLRGRGTGSDVHASGAAAPETNTRLPFFPPGVCVAASAVSRIRRLCHAACQVVYREWTCAMLVPVYPVPSARPSRHRQTQGGSPEHRQPPDDDGEPADDLVPLRPCREFCHRVEEQCPYFHPTTREQYAGEPVFICIDPNIPDLPSISNSSYGPPGNCYRPCHVNASLGPSDQCPAATLSTALLGPSPVPMGAANSAGRAGGRTSAPPGGPVLVEQQQSAPCPDGPLAKGPHQRRGPAPPAWASGPATRRPPATQWPPPLKYRGERFYYNDGGTTLRVFRGGPIPVLPSRCRHLGRKPGRDGRKPRRPVPPPSGERVCPTGDRTTLSTPS